MPSMYHLRGILLSEATIPSHLNKSIYRGPPCVSKYLITQTPVPVVCFNGQMPAIETHPACIISEDGTTCHMRLKTVTWVGAIQDVYRNLFGSLGNILSNAQNTDFCQWEGRKIAVDA